MFPNTQEPSAAGFSPLTAPSIIGDGRRCARLRLGRLARARRGAVLVEFAFIALAFYLLFAGTFEVGRMVFTSQLLQNAARVGARELALVPLPASYTFERAIGVDVPLDALTPADLVNVLNVRRSVYDPSLLAYEVTDPTTLQTTLDGWPALNRMLVPLMIRETIAGRDWLHYPGVLISDTFNSPGHDGVTVAVPQVIARTSNSSETIRWVAVVEEVKADINGDGVSDAGPFSALSTAPQRGLVALRINYPFQAATMVAYRDDPSTPFPNDVVLANGSVTQENAAPGAILPSDSETGAYSGQFGLGVHLAHGNEVRPFSRFLTAQSMFRREVFK
ncbi:MAG: TadE/TadG family type IV pilus assembly protein [Planctomycetota bacterium]